MADDLPGGVGGGFEIASAYVQVDPNAETFEEQLEEQLGELNYVVQIPVVPDTEDFAEQVSAAVEESKATVSVPVVPDTEDFKKELDESVAGSSAAPVEVPVVPDTAGFAEKLDEETAEAKTAVEVPIVPDMAGFAEKVEEESAAAGEASGAAFSEKLGAVAAAAPIFPAAAVEREAETAAEDSGEGFLSRFGSVLGGIGGAFAGVIPGLAREGEEAGEKTSASFLATMKGAFLGDTSLLEVALGAGFVAATAIMASKFQSTMEQIHTQAGVGQSAIRGLSNDVLDLASKVGESPDSLSQALYHVESAFQSTGITGQNAMKIVQTAAEGARTGGADLVDVVNALDGLLVSGIGGIHNYGQAMGALNAIVGSGDMKMQDLADAMGTGIAAVAKSYGQNIYEVGAALATFGDNNIRGAKAATDLRMAMQAIQEPVATGAAALQHLGLTTGQLGETMEHHGLIAALQEFVDHLEASKVPVSDWGEYMTEIFGKRAGVGIGVLVDQLDRMEGKLPDIERGAKDFGSAWQATEATTSQKLHDLEAGFEALAIRIGTALLPTINRFIGDLDNALPSIEHFGAEIAHMVSPVVHDFFIGLDAILKVMLGPLRDVTIAVAAFGAAWIVLDAVMAINPFVAIGIALITLVGVIVRYHAEIFRTIEDTWHDIASFFTSIAGTLFDPVEHAFDAIKDFITSSFDGWWASHGQEIEAVWNAVWGAISAVFKVWWDVNKAILTAAWDIISTTITAGLAAVELIWNTTWQLVSAAFSAAWDVMMAYVKTWWDSIEALFKIAWDIVVGIFNVALDLLTGNWSKAWDDAQSTVEQVWHAIETFFQQAWNNIKSLFGQELNIVKNLLSSAWSSAESDVKTVWNAILSFLQGIWKDIENGFSGAVAGIKKVWGTLETIFKTPVSFLVNTVYDKGIARLWNDVAGKIPGIPKMPVVSFAKGGKLPGYGGGDVHPALLESGETVVSKEHSRVLAPAFKAVGVPGYSSGGPAGSPGGKSSGGGGIWSGITTAAKSVGSAIGGAFDDIVDVTKILAALTTGNTTALSNALDALVKTKATGDLGQMMTALPKALIKDAVGGIASAVKKLVSGGPGGGTSTPYSGGYGAGVAQWVPDILTVFKMLGIPTSDLGIVESQMMTESGGNPNAINLWDSNAAAGDPSRGLMQTIMTTFDAYRSSALSDNIYNPLANIYAGLNYAMHEYGANWTNVLGHGHGYATGGVIGEPVLGVGASGDMYSFGENGPETVVPGASGMSPPVMSSTSGSPVVNVYFTGMQYPNAEQIAALQMNLAHAIGVAAS